MAVETDAQAWAQALFGRCELGDKRRTARLITTAASLAVNGGGSVARACKTDAASHEGGYRFLRNPQVKVVAMDDAGFQATAERIQDVARVLAIDDSTTLSYRHRVSEQLGYTGSKKDSVAKGFMVHSTLLVDANSGVTQGLIAQHRWIRDAARYGKKHQRKQTAYEDKESYKWTRNAQAMRARLGDKMSAVIAVCDRESDIFHYLHEKRAQGERFIVRAAQDRILCDGVNTHLFEALEKAEKCGEMRVTVPQRGGREARETVLMVRAKTVTIRAPHADIPRDRNAMLTVNVLLAQEENSTQASPLRWLLLTTEAITSETQWRDTLRCYALRWRIEEFHKAWKSGAKVEKMRMQKVAHLERMIVLLAFVAIRLLQLRETLDNAHAAQQPCTDVLSDLQWKVLWASDAKNPRVLPKTTPTLRWAHDAIARLGGFYNSKRTGRASWATIYEGWTRLDDRVQSYHLLTALGSAIT